jgi:hypothetical protein
MMLLLLQCIAGVEVLILIAEMPVLFNSLLFHVNDYIHGVTSLNTRIFTFDHFYTADGRNSLFPYIFDRYIDSMKMLGLGIIIAVAISFVISYLALFFFRKQINHLKFLLEIVESIPDLMLILLLQFVVIFIFKTTGVKLAQVVSVREEAILLPIISLCIPISCYITRVLLHHIEEEIEKHLELSAPIIAEVRAKTPSGKLTGLFEPISIEVKNYRSYIEETFDFRKIKFAMVNGVNGIGKSALFMDAITDCLYEETGKASLLVGLQTVQKRKAVQLPLSLEWVKVYGGFQGPGQKAGKQH